MTIIDVQKIREALPKHAEITLAKTKHLTPYFEIYVEPSMTDKDFEISKINHREIIGKENIMEFYTEETGHHWKIFLERKPYEFINL